MKELRFNRNDWQELIAGCKTGYPKEVCGILLGSCHGKVEKVIFLPNIADGNHSHRLSELAKAGAISIDPNRMNRGGLYEFVFDPAQVNAALQPIWTSQPELDQIGVFHSHPDHPAEPSVTDASQPYLSGWSNVIVAVHEGKFKEARSWYRETEDSSFQEERILVG